MFLFFKVVFICSFLDIWATHQQSQANYVLFKLPYNKKRLKPNNLCQII